VALDLVTEAAAVPVARKAAAAQRKQRAAVVAPVPVAAAVLKQAPAAMLAAAAADKHLQINSFSHSFLLLFLYTYYPRSILHLPKFEYLPILHSFWVKK
jgi:hypothetical protein